MYTVLRESTMKWEYVKQLLSWLMHSKLSTKVDYFYYCLGIEPVSLDSRVISVQNQILSLLFYPNNQAESTYSENSQCYEKT